MNAIATISSVIAALTGIIMVWNSKGNVIKRIERKRQQISDLETQVYRRYGVNANIRNHSPWNWKINKLERQIEELEKRI